MKTKLFTRTTLLLTVAALLALPAPRATSQTVTDEIEVLRSVLKADRKVVIAEALQLTEAESTVFWPFYREYRTEVEKLGDGIVKLALEYADVYPNVPKKRAQAMLKEYLALEQKLVSKRAWYLKRAGKILSAAKALRLAQVENRMDLVLRLQLAGAVPLMPATQTKP